MRTKKDMHNINSVTDHYQKVMGAPKTIYTERMGSWLIGLLIGLIVLSIGVISFYFIFIK